MSNQLLMRRRMAKAIEGVRPDYFRITPISGPCIVTPKVACSIYIMGGVYNKSHFDGYPSDIQEYLFNDYLEWNIEYSINSGGFRKVAIYQDISLSDGDYVEFRYNPQMGVRTTLNIPDPNIPGYTIFPEGGTIVFRPDTPYIANGNIMSLLDGRCQNSIISDKAFGSFFADDKNLIGYDGVIKISDIISSDLGFSHNNLSWMFDGCNNLVIPPIIKTPLLLQNEMWSMFSRCSSAQNYDFSSLDSSQSIFHNNTSARTLIIRNPAPPSILSNTIAGLSSDCIIYVPYSSDHSVLNAYKAAQYWSDRANYIFELDENGEIPE